MIVLSIARVTSDTNFIKIKKSNVKTTMSLTRIMQTRNVTTSERKAIQTSNYAALDNMLPVLGVRALTLYTYGSWFQIDNRLTPKMEYPTNIKKLKKA